MTKKTPLSVVINTKNAAQTLQATLDSVTGLAAEIVVMDMASTDQTTEIARSAGARVFSHPDVGYVEPARNAAIAKATHDWILILDADETLEAVACEKIAQLIAKDSEVSAYFLPRKNIIFGSWIAHTGWWPDHQLRLFKKDSVTWSDAIHSIPKVTGQSKKLEPDQQIVIVHTQYPTVTDFLQKLDRYTTIEATSNHKQSGEQDQFQPDALISLYFSEIFRRLFADHGIKDGNHGISLAFLQANYQLITRLKRWEAAGFERQTDEMAVLGQLDQVIADMRYWIADYQVRRTTGLTKFYWQVRRALKR